MKKHYHFVGIGGVGMSALARILLQKGEKVSGSDLKESMRTNELKKDGAEIFVGHQESNVNKATVVVYSTDVPQDNPEIVAAKQKGIPVIHRSEMLGKMVVGYAPLLVTGTHGKTTTSSLLAHTLLEAGRDPSFAVGGYLSSSNTNSHFGKGHYFVAEADESDGSFINYPGFGAIITNLEHDHMNFWKTEEALVEGFRKFAAHIASKKHLFWCYDDKLLKTLHLKGYSYGFTEGADLFIENFRQVHWHMIFDLTFEGKRYREIQIPLIGAHNVLNAAAVFGLGCKLDLTEEQIRQGLVSFPGVGRRLEKKGAFQTIDIYDDYAHHPTEIFATLRALKNATAGKRIVLAFQPHRYSRTKCCLDDFADAFEYADEVVITEVYAAHETPIPELTPDKILSRIKAGGYQKIRFVERANLPQFLSQFLQPKDVLITMGAGDITAVGPAVLDVLNE